MVQRIKVHVDEVAWTGAHKTTAEKLAKAKTPEALGRWLKKSP